MKQDDLRMNRVPLIARSWDLGSEEVETQGGNWRNWESERGRESVEKCCFCLQNDLKKNIVLQEVYILPLKKPGLRHLSQLSKKSNIRFVKK